MTVNSGINMVVLLFIDIIRIPSALLRVGISSRPLLCDDNLPASVDSSPKHGRLPCHRCWMSGRFLHAFRWLDLLENGSLISLFSATIVMLGLYPFQSVLKLCNPSCWGALFCNGPDPSHGNPLAPPAYQGPNPGPLLVVSLSHSSMQVMHPNPSLSCLSAR
ncbi:hypothetical protein KSP40_PGU015394 [Platanthera guangdongensis]|uniref:Uncharacterized protein n=1 Tax=Platanthera guangdongensis TaxID=2320717 RepID=A0ABR2LED7_9ASPA